jgi:Xaa-Pro aminopeptidase
MGTAALDHERRSAAYPAARRSAANGADADVRQSGNPGADDRGARSARRHQQEVRERCIESYDAGLKALKPGITFADLLAAMEEPHRAAGCWGYTPVVHSLGPHFLAGRTQVNIDQANLNVTFVGPNAARQREAVIEPGMVFAFEPNACIGNHRVNIGGTVVVTATGCEELNHIPSTVTHKQ